MATLVREAAEPLHEQEAQAQALREEVSRQTARVAEVRPHQKSPISSSSFQYFR